MPDLYMSLERNLWLSLFGIYHSVDDEYPFRSMVARSYHGSRNLQTRYLANKQKANV